MRAPNLYRYCSSLLFLICFAAITWGCTKNDGNAFQGYIEGEYLLVSSPLAGKLERLNVSRGMRIEAGTLLFSLEQTFEEAAVREAEQRLNQAQKKLDDLTKGLRPTELEQIRAKIEHAKAAYELSRMEYERRTKLFEQKVIAKDQLDRTRTELEQNRETVKQLEAELETAGLGSRPDQIEAARAEMEAARSRLAQAGWNLEQKTQKAPVDALVFDTFYVQGEFVPAAYPIVSLLPPANIRIRFFVPEEILSTLSPTQTVFVRLDGTGRTIPAKISYISPAAEYTPPVIYSRETRSKLVYRIEADFTPDDAAALNPGQPVDVFLEAPHG